MPLCMPSLLPHDLCHGWSSSRWPLARTDWLDLLAVQETLKSLLWQHSLKASPSALSFFMVQFLYPHMTDGDQREELRPWQRSRGRRLGIRKGMIKPQETPCSRASNPQTRVCFMLSPTPLTSWGALPHNHFSRRRSKPAAPRQ